MLMNFSAVSVDDFGETPGRVASVKVQQIIGIKYININMPLYHLENSMDSSLLYL